MEKISDYLSKAHYVIRITNDQAEIAEYLASRAASCWGQGPVGNTGYYKLVHTSPNSVREKPLVILCPISALPEEKVV
jgi:hypothetical protein